jgi:oligopeptide transport system ATP-binding protein
MITASMRRPLAEAETLLEVDDLAVHFPVHKGLFFRREVGTVRAVDGVSFTLKRGETLGLVGESGCGKSTTGRAILQLVRPTRGRVVFSGDDLVRHWKGAHPGPGMRPVRRRMQMIFQDPYASLNPRMTVFDIIAEPLRNFGQGRAETLRRRVHELMEQVGMDARFVRRYPHEFSGGQRQRIGIARALALSPELVICDEPVSALDVSIQAQVLNLLGDLQARMSLTYLFIAHDLAAVRHISDRIAVMYLGRIVELADAATITKSPKHPYTKALISAVPIPDPRVERARRRLVLAGDVPSPMNPPSGCPFHPRCAEAVERCKTEIPLVRELAPGHTVACHLAEVG